MGRGDGSCLFQTDYAWQDVSCSRPFRSLTEACNFITADYTKPGILSAASFDRYEIVIRYSNGDKIEMQSREPQAALAGLMRLM